MLAKSQLDWHVFDENDKDGEREGKFTPRGENVLSFAVWVIQPRLLICPRV